MMNSVKYIYFGDICDENDNDETCDINFAI